MARREQSSLCDGPDPPVFSSSVRRLNPSMRSTSRGSRARRVGGSTTTSANRGRLIPPGSRGSKPGPPPRPASPKTPGPPCHQPPAGRELDRRGGRLPDPRELDPTGLPGVKAGSNPPTSQSQDSGRSSWTPRTPCAIELPRDRSSTPTRWGGVDFHLRELELDPNGLPGVKPESPDHQLINSIIVQTIESSSNIPSKWILSSYPGLQY